MVPSGYPQRKRQAVALFLLISVVCSFLVLLVSMPIALAQTGADPASADPISEPSDPPFAPDDPQTNEVLVHATQADQTVDVRVGQQLVVSLPGNPTTGFTWEVAQIDESILSQDGATTFQPDSSAIGAGGTITLRFETKAAGESPLTLIYHRPFEPNTPPAQTFSVTVQVAAAATQETEPETPALPTEPTATPSTVDQDGSAGGPPAGFDSVGKG